MANEMQFDPQMVKIQGLISQFLGEGARHGSSTAAAGHLNEDTISAFVEGSISEREALPAVDHLVDCRFCRDITARMVRLDIELAGSTAEVPVAENQPVGIATVLQGILERIFGTGEAAVFAHEERKDEKEADEDLEKK